MVDRQWISEPRITADFHGFPWQCDPQNTVDTGLPRQMAHLTNEAVYTSISRAANGRIAALLSCCVMSASVTDDRSWTLLKNILTALGCSFLLHGLADPQFFHAIPKGAGGKSKYTCSTICALDLPSGIFKGVENLHSFHFSQSFSQFGPGFYIGRDDKAIGQLQY